MPRIEGDLHLMPLSDLLQWLQSSLVSGSLEIRNETESYRIYVDSGSALLATGTGEGRIGETLVDLGKITPAQLEEGLKIQSLRRQLQGLREEERLLKLGELFQEKGWVEAGDVREALSNQLRNRMFRLFLWNEGSFLFTDKLPDNFDSPFRVKLDALLFEGVYRIDRWRRVKESIPSLDMVVFPAHEAPIVGDLREYQPLIGRILDAMDGELTIRQLAKALKADLLEVAYILRELLHRKMISLGEAALVEDGEEMTTSSLDRMVSETRVALEHKEYWEAAKLIEEIQFQRGEPVMVAMFRNQLEQAMFQEVLVNWGSIYRFPRFTPDAEKHLAGLPQDLYTMALEVRPELDGTLHLAGLLRRHEDTRVELLAALFALEKEGVLTL